MWHTIQQGECLSSIAAAYRFPDWRIVYNHASNADFRALRPNPNIILPGDQLFIPDLRLKQIDKPTDRKHTFLLRRQPTWLNLRIQDSTGQAIANAPYELVIDDRRLKGSTDGDGWIRTRIPPLAEEGALRVWPSPNDPDTVIEWPVQLGHLDPLDTVSGVKARLTNLGYPSGEIDEDPDDRYLAAVRQFQQDAGIAIDGIVGPQTRAHLLSAHQV